MSLFAIVLTYNEGRHIHDCIETLRFADHILIFDSLSTDDTVHIARNAGAEVTQRRFDNYAGQRNAALEYVADKADWVLFVDADERVTPELSAEIQSVIQTTKHVGFRIPRHNYIFGKLTKGAGWYPDYQTRLLRVGKTHYDPERQVHELVILEGSEGTLIQPFIHFNYDSLSQFHDKQKRYSDYDARILFEQGIRPKPQNYVLQPIRQFRWRYITLKGYQDGWHGLRLSLLMAWYELRKYRVLHQLWSQKNRA
ncbi:MAG: glycosyltransferase family 2 protein [Chloroflexi bacterium]|nr:glycosyltransferase family 2 protein [Chloroflexota bacterium]